MRNLDPEDPFRPTQPIPEQQFEHQTANEKPEYFSNEEHKQNYFDNGFEEPSTIHHQRDMPDLDTLPVYRQQDNVSTDQHHDPNFSEI